VSIRHQKSAAKQLETLMDEFDRLEELIEDMDELGVFSKEAAEIRMTELDHLIEVLTPDNPDRG
jgi:hypothetical protein